MLSKLKPALPRPWLKLLSGLMWSGVGIMLGRLAWGWLRLLDLSQAILLGFIGILLAMGIGGLGFGPLARKNLERIARLPSRPCLFAFQAWTSYPLVVVMIGLGITLRHSPIPKTWLAALYLGIGGGLFLASIYYYADLAKLLIQQRAQHA